MKPPRSFSQITARFTIPPGAGTCSCGAGERLSTFSAYGVQSVAVMKRSASCRGST